MSKKKYTFPPWKIKMVESIPMLSRSEREQAIRRAGYNTFNLRSDEITIDLLSDSGTNAVSTAQYAHSVLAPEAVGTVALHELFDTVKKVYGKEHCLTFHQGRAAEKLIFDVLAKDRKHVVGNSYFLTTLEFARNFGVEWHDLIVEKAYSPESPDPFKGNMDLDKLRQLVKEVGSEQIAFVRMEANVNIIGGQPFSLENVRSLRKLADEWGLLLVLDATLLSENASFIWQREFDRKTDPSPAKILYMVAELFDMIYVSSKRDHIAPSGGLLMTNDPNLFEKLKVLWELLEGIGISARDMAIITQGIRESLDERYLDSRIRQVRDLGNKILSLGLPVFLPVGGHAVHLDVKKILPHVASNAFPAQALAAAYYVVSGVRSMEMGSVALDIDRSTKKEHYPGLEMLRLAVPRRVYTHEHLEYAAYSLEETCREGKKIRGLRLVYEPRILRSFKAKFAPID